MFSTIGKLENRIPLSIRSKEGRLDCSVTCLDTFGFGLLRLVEEDVPAARAVAAAAAAAADDFEAERGCFCIPLMPDNEGLRRGGLAPGGNGFFLGGAIFKQENRLCFYSR